MLTTALMLSIFAADGEAGGGERYYGMVSAAVHRFYDVSNTIPESERIRLAADVVIRLDGQGGLLEVKFVKPSENAVFNDALLAAVKKAAPFGPPPPALKDMLATSGVPLRFRADASAVDDARVRTVPGRHAPPDPPPSPLDALKGFQKAEWGMPVAKVKVLFPGAQTLEKETVMLPKTRVANLDAALVFNFDDAGLYGVMVLFAKEQKGTATFEQLCSALREGLEAKYGAPATEKSQLGGPLIGWSGEKTTVGLSCDQFAISPKTPLSIVYISAAKLAEKPNVKSDDL